MNSKNLNLILLLLTYFATQHGVINAMKRSHTQISNSKKNEPLPTLKKTKLNNKTAAFLCNICNKSFTQQGHLTVHKRIHTGEKPYSCNTCDKTFYQSNDLIKHERTHTGEKPYTCDICNKTFSQNSNRTEHMKIHSGEKPYACDLCNKKFTRQSDLTIHKRTHTKEKPYPCNICYKSFRTSSALTRHEKIHIKIIPLQINLLNNNTKYIPNNLSLKSLNTPTDSQDILENIMTLNDTEFNKWIGK